MDRFKLHKRNAARHEKVRQFRAQVSERERLQQHEDSEREALTCSECGRARRSSAAGGTLCEGCAAAEVRS